MLMTVIVVLSGFFGRYIYTSIPRTADGAEIEVIDIQNEIAMADNELKHWERTHSNEVKGDGRVSPRKRLDPAERAQLKYIKQLTKRRDQLRRQVASLAMTRRLFALWHAVHIPVGLTLFIAAFIHILGAIYYATLLH